MLLGVFMSQVCTKKLPSQIQVSLKSWPAGVVWAFPDGRAEEMTADVTTPAGRAAIAARVVELGGDHEEISDRLDGVRGTEELGVFFEFQGSGSPVVA